MKYFEFGREHPELMVILHGGGVCYRGALPDECPARSAEQKEKHHTSTKYSAFLVETGALPNGIKTHPHAVVEDE